MKTVLCYGDSNTWGADPSGQVARLGEGIRWPSVLRAALGPDYWVIEEGLSGRTTVFDDPIEGRHKNGLTYLVPCLESHRPLDVVVLMLGTNDLKYRLGLGPDDIARGAEVLVQTIKQSGCGPDGRTPTILLIAPPPISTLKHLSEMFAGAAAKSQELGRFYAEVAQRQNVAFLNAGDVIVSSPLDGIHFEASEHAKLGAAVAAQLLGGS